MAVANGAGVEFPCAEGDGLVMEVEIAGQGLITGWFFPSFELAGNKIGRDTGAAGGFLPSADFPDEGSGGGVEIFT